MLDAEKYHRRSIRWAGYDYGATGAYFVTLCAIDKKLVFGKIMDNAMHPNYYGTIAHDCWVAIPEHFQHVFLDEFVLMPNHFHGILLLNNSVSHVGPITPPENVIPGSLGAIIRSFKAAVSRQTNIYRKERGLSPVRVWQRNYYERIIRDERELDLTRKYIIENPQCWATDKNNPSSNP